MLKYYIKVLTHISSCLWLKTMLAAVFLVNWKQIFGKSKIKRKMIFRMILSQLLKLWRYLYLLTKHMLCSLNLSTALYRNWNFYGRRVMLLIVYYWIQSVYKKSTYILLKWDSCSFLRLSFKFKMERFFWMSNQLPSIGRSVETLGCKTVSG